MNRLLLACALLVAVTLPSSAQNIDTTTVPYFSILSPGYLTHQYAAAQSEYTTAAFGPAFNNDIVADLAVADDGDPNGIDGDKLCNPNAQDFTGKIVLIARGICEFSEKILQAQQQGAAGVIIWNFQEGSILMAPGSIGGGGQIHIPAIMVSKSVGDAMAVAVQQGETVKVAFSVGPASFGRIIGRITGDLNDDCAFQAGEPGLGNWWVTAAGANQSYSVRTRADGSYCLFADSINSPYTVSASPLNALWQSCPPASGPVNITAATDTVQLDFSAQPTALCPQLSAEIGTPFLRRCFENWFQVEICNYGSIAAENAYAIIHLDTPGFDPIQNASLAYTVEPNGDYRFELEDLAIGDCKHLQFSAVINCDSSSVGQQLCFSVHAYPDTVCAQPNPNWNGANVVVSGDCVNDTPLFTLKNTGSAPMSQSGGYVVFRNAELYQTGHFQLVPGETQEIYLLGDGATWHVEATQEPNHPTGANPAATLEGCHITGSITPGFALQFATYNPQGAIDQECQEVIGAWDPNDKQGFPRGLTDEHLILPNTELEYLIRFQNTGTDTAFNIVVRDTLSSSLEAASIRPELGSAPYELEIADGNVLIFRFKGIKLVDSFTNEAASHGFVRFRIRQKPDLALGTEIENTAAIYFDFNPPVLTNTTQHKLGTVPQASATLEVIRQQRGTLNVFPNPAPPATEISLQERLQERLPDGCNWRLMAASGKTVDAGVVEGQRLKIKNQRLPAGVYWIEFNHAGKWMGVAKWVVQ